jgi:hypothetical protein
MLSALAQVSRAPVDPENWPDRRVAVACQVVVCAIDSAEMGSQLRPIVV